MKKNLVEFRFVRKERQNSGSLKNTENLTSHHFTYIKKYKKSVPPLAIVPENKRSWWSQKLRWTWERITIRFSFHTPPSETSFFSFFFRSDSERANVLSNKYLFNLGTTAQYFSASCIGFWTSLYSVVAYLIKCSS